MSVLSCACDASQHSYLVFFAVSTWLFSLVLWTRLAYVFSYHQFLRRRPGTQLARALRFTLAPVHLVATWHPFAPVFQPRIYSLLRDFEKHPTLSSRLLARTKTHRLQRAVARWYDDPPSQQAVSLLAARLTDTDSQRHIIKFMVADPHLLRTIALRHLGPDRSASATSSTSPSSTSPSSTSSPSSPPASERPGFVGLVSAISASPAASYIAALDLDFETGMDLMWWISIQGNDHPLLERWPTSSNPTEVFHRVQVLSPHGTIRAAIDAVEALAPTSITGWDVVLSAALENCTTPAGLHEARDLLARNAHLIETVAKLLSSGAPRDLEQLFAAAAVLAHDGGPEDRGTP